nr:MAG TPA: hypothetical protein [Caudoviricetes sp.]
MPVNIELRRVWGIQLSSTLLFHFYIIFNKNATKNNNAIAHQGHGCILLLTLPFHDISFILLF